MKKGVKVAAVQLNSGPDKDENLAKASAFVSRAVRRGAEFIVLPEAFNYRGPLDSPRERQGAAEAIPGRSLRPLMRLAGENKVHILAGSVYEKLPGITKVCNTSALIDPTGRIIARYRKRHLFNVRVDGRVIRESAHCLPGRRGRIARVNQFQVGMTICFDLRFPEDYRAMSARGADVFVVPSSFTRTTGKAHWKALLRARAVENLAYVIAPNQTGKDSLGAPCFGHSMIVDPWGRALAEASGDGEEVVYAWIDKKILKEKRRMMGGVLGRRSAF